MILNEKSSELNTYAKAFESSGQFYLSIACFKFDCNSKLLEGIMSAELLLPFLSAAFWKLCIHHQQNNPVFRFSFSHEVGLPLRDISNMYSTAKLILVFAKTIFRMVRLSAESTSVYAALLTGF